MSRHISHRISDWLYNTSFFTRFYERIAGRFAIDLIQENFHQTFLTLIPHGGTLLEIGAGPGLLALKILKSRPDIRIIATDYSPRMLELARGNLANASRKNSSVAALRSRIEYMRANAMDLSQFNARPIQGIYSMGAAKHFPDPVTCLHQMYNVLQARGRLYIMDSCMSGSYAGTGKIMTKLNISPIAAFFLQPLLHVGLNSESPSASEIQSWRYAFSNEDDVKIEFLLGGSIFKLTYHKPQRPG